jgi:hypothetical protein
MRCEGNGEEMLAVKFYVICVWKMDPKAIVTKHLLPLYIYLPAMDKPPADLVIQALREMAHYYSRAELAYRFTWFLYILRRTETMSDPDKQIIEEALHTMLTYEEIIQDDPVIQNLLAQEALVAEACGEAHGLQKSILSLLSIRFPALAAMPQVQQTVSAIEDTEKLDLLFQAMLLTSDEQIARGLLKLPPQGNLP